MAVESQIAEQKQTVQSARLAEPSFAPISERFAGNFHQSAGRLEPLDRNMKAHDRAVIGKIRADISYADKLTRTQQAQLALDLREIGEPELLALLLGRMSPQTTAKPTLPPLPPMEELNCKSLDGFVMRASSIVERLVIGTTPETVNPGVAFREMEVVSDKLLGFIEKAMSLLQIVDLKRSEIETAILKKRRLDAYAAKLLGVKPSEPITEILETKTKQLRALRLLAKNKKNAHQQTKSAP